MLYWALMFWCGFDCRGSRFHCIAVAADQHFKSAIFHLPGTVCDHTGIAPGPTEAAE